MNCLNNECLHNTKKECSMVNGIILTNTGECENDIYLCNKCNETYSENNNCLC